MAETPCPRHEDTSRRMNVLETQHEAQIVENARIWKAVNLIREEKATDSSKLQSLVDSVDELKIQLTRGLDRLGKEIQELKDKPAKRWESILATILSAAVAMVLGVLGTMLFSGKVVP